MFGSGWVHYVSTLAKSEVGSVVSIKGDVGTSCIYYYIIYCPAEIVRHQQEQMRLVEQLRKQEERLHTVYGAPPAVAGAALANTMVQLQGQLPSLFGEMKQEVRSHSSLVPRPRPASHRLQYSKAGEGLVHFLT